MWHGDAGDAVASPMLKGWPLFGKNFSTFGQSLQLLSHRAGLKSMQPMRLHWAPRHGGWAGCLFLPDTPCTREL